MGHRRGRYVRPSPIAPDHLAVASLLVVNKIDRIETDDAARERLAHALKTHAPGTPVVRTRFGVLDPALLFDVADRGEPTGQLSFADLLRESALEDADAHSPEHAHEHSHQDEHAHDQYVSVALDSERPADPRRLVAFLEGRAPGLYRVKGRAWVDADGPQEYVVQAVGGWVAFERTARGREVEPRTQLVAIGTGVDAGEVRAALEACLTDPGTTPADHLHAITRYTR